MNAVPIVLFWMLALWGMASRGPVLIYLYFATMPFGAFAILPTAITGGLTLTPTPIVALLIIARTFVNRRGPSTFLALAVLPDRLLLLFLFWVVAGIATVFMPRLFAGDVMVVPMRGDLTQAMPLQPSAQNISQFAYLSISIASVFALTCTMQSPTARQHALKALCLSGGLAAITGFVDLASFYLPLGPLLAPFRTASYALLTDVEIMGSKRIVGLMPEASSFGGLCLGLLSALYFYRRAIADPRVRDLYAPIVMVLLALCCWLSTSSGTIVGVAILALVCALEWMLRLNVDQRKSSLYRRGLAAELSVVTCVTIGLAVLLIASPTILDPILTLIDRMVLEKGSSSSFEQRGMWRNVAMTSLLQTHGFGVGLGGTRSSSSAVGVFACTGVIGGALYYAFLLQTLFRRAYGTTTETHLLMAAFRFSFVAPFMVALMVGDADFGPITAFCLAMTTALAIAAKRPPLRNPSVRQERDASPSPTGDQPHPASAVPAE
ncbi:hypothetical protein WBP07_01795 [Novosphingobium sp. BL-8A]|uniref:hypothetical protein n=1 Tax=Novosphingobium sp. BL-8A TaxID=3127639 RepID=UPI0037568C11